MALWLLLCLSYLFVEGRQQGIEVATQDNSEQGTQQQYLEPDELYCCFPLTYDYLLHEGTPTYYSLVPSYGFAHSSWSRWTGHTRLIILTGHRLAFRTQRPHWVLGLDL